MDIYTATTAYDLVPCANPYWCGKTRRPGQTNGQISLRAGRKHSDARLGRARSLPPSRGAFSPAPSRADSHRARKSDSLFR